MTTPCPSAETLARLDRDSVSPASLASIEDHVESCDACRLALAALLRDSPGTGGDHCRRGPAREEWPRIPGFVIEGKLGSGGMGVVYRARQEEIGRLVAIKVLARGHEAGTRRREDWLREARTLATVPRHPNVVRLLQTGQHDGCLYLVMDLVPGGSLVERLGTPLAPKPAAAILETVARAVDHIHRAGVLHLDIKPSNILLDGPPDASWDQVSPQLGDFGIARLGNETGLTQTQNGPRGTLSYMAPEQLELGWRAAGFAADVHALGATFYHMLTGRPPYEGTASIADLRLLEACDPPRPSLLSPVIPRDLETICLKCLHREPGRRYASAGALADDLRRWAEGRPIEARPASTWEIAWRWARRRPAVSGLLALLGLTIVVSFAALFGLWRRAATSRAMAEANYRATSDSRNELLNVILGSYDGERPPGPFIDILETARRQEQALARARPRDTPIQRRLATIDRLMALAYQKVRRLDEARSALKEAMGLWHLCLAQGPENADDRWEQFRSSLLFGRLLGDSALDDAVVSVWNREMTSILGRLARTPHFAAATYDLSELQRRIAERLVRNGQPGRGERLLRESLQLLDSLPADAGSRPGVAASRLVTWSALGDKAIRLDLLRPVVRTERQSLATHELLNHILAELAAHQVGWGTGLGTSPRADDEKTSPEEWADRTVRFLERQCSTLGREPSSIPKVGFRMYRSASHLSSEQRLSGELAEAHVTVARLHALAEALVHLQPRHPEAHLLESEAYVQMAKNAYRDDPAAVGPFLAKALEAAVQASAIDPEYPDVRKLLDDRRARLNRHTSNE